MAVADGALFGYDTLADLQEQEIPAGKNELILRFQRVGLRQADPPPRSAARDTSAPLRFTLFGDSWARRWTYTEVQRSQHLTQTDPRIFGQSYLANTSSADGQVASLGERVDHSHIDYFQSLERFREPGLPCELPAHIEESLRQDPRLQQLESEVQSISGKDALSCKESKKRLASYLKTLKGNALRQDQETLIQQRRDWKIVSRGKEEALDLIQTDLVRSLCLLIPERARLAERLASDEPLMAETKWLAMQDLYTLCTRDFSVLYLPCNQPIGGA